MSDQLGHVQQFSLVLKQLQEIDGRRCALFEASIKIFAGDNAPTKMDVQGTVAIELATCRTIAANLSGPLKMKAFEKNFQYLAEGACR